MFSPYSSLEASPAEASPQARYLPSPPGLSPQRERRPHRPSGAVCGQLQVNVQLLIQGPAHSLKRPGMGFWREHFIHSLIRSLIQQMFLHCFHVLKQF